MGKLIKIDKYQKSGDVHYYFVSTTDFDARPFYMAINTKFNSVSFYLTNDFTVPLKVIDLNDEDAIIVVPEVDKRLMWHAIGQATKAMKKNNFPEQIDYIA